MREKVTKIIYLNVIVSHKGLSADSGILPVPAGGHDHQLERLDCFNPKMRDSDFVNYLIRQDRSF